MPVGRPARWTGDETQRAAFEPLCPSILTTFIDIGASGTRALAGDVRGLGPADTPSSCRIAESSKSGRPGKTYWTHLSTCTVMPNNCVPGAFTVGAQWERTSRGLSGPGHADPSSAGTSLTGMSYLTYASDCEQGSQ
jgi:hypothetical protein